MGTMCNMFKQEVEQEDSEVWESSYLILLHHLAFLLLNVWSGDRQHWHHLGACEKCRMCISKGSHIRIKVWEAVTHRRTCGSRFLTGRMILAKTFCKLLQQIFGEWLFWEQRVPVLIKCLQNETKIMNEEPCCQFNRCVTLNRLLNFFASHFPRLSIKLEL